MGSQVLGSWNKEARTNSSLYRVREAAVAAAQSGHSCALTLSVLLGMHFSFALVTEGTHGLLFLVLR